MKATTTDMLKDTENTTSRLLGQINVKLTVEAGSTMLRLKDVLALSEGETLTLDRDAAAPVDICISGVLFARGEIVMIGERYGIKINEIVSIP